MGVGVLLPVLAISRPQALLPAVRVWRLPRGWFQAVASDPLAALSQALRRLRSSLRNGGAVFRRMLLTQLGVLRQAVPPSPGG